MKVRVVYTDDRIYELENITNIYKYDYNKGVKTEINPKEDIIKNGNIYQLIGNHINYTLDLKNRLASYTSIHF